MIAILQTRLFSGKFSSCYVDHLGWSQLKTKQLVKTKWDCLSYGGEWIAPDLNFDTLNRSFTTLMSIASTEGWT